MSKDDLHLQFVEAILRGGTSTSGKGIVGKNYHETTQLRAEWLARMMPKTAGFYGIEGDGVKRLGERE